MVFSGFPVEFREIHKKFTIHNGSKTELTMFFFREIWLKGLTITQNLTKFVVQRRSSEIRIYMTDIKHIWLNVRKLKKSNAGKHDNFYPERRKELVFIDK